MMFKKLKLVLATSAVLVGGVAGFAAADTVGGTKPKDQSAQRSEMHEARKARMLEKFDTNKDGTLDDTERAAAKEARATEMFQKLDTNKDGKLSFDEFKAGRDHHARGGMHRHHRGRDGGGGRDKD